MPRPAIIKPLVASGLDDDEVEATFERLAGHEYQGVECGTNYDPDVVAAALDRHGLVATDVMAGENHVKDPEAELVGVCDALGANRAVLGWLDDTHFDTPEAVQETAEFLNDCADRLADHGLEFCYHNHDHEFHSLGDRTAMEILLEHLNDDVKFEVDVGWVGVGGVSPAEFLERHADRIPLVHLKDMDYETGESVRLGEGDLDVEAVVRAAARADVDWLIYEHEQPVDAAENAAHGGRMLNELLDDLDARGENR